MKKTFFVAQVAVFSALVFVATVLVAIPSPSTSGYVNFGDTVVFVSSAFLGPFGGLVAGGVGSMLADLVYSPVWMPVTFIVKGLEGFVSGLLFSILKKKLQGKLSLPASIGISFTVGAVIMVMGYYVGGGVLLGISSDNISVGFTASAMDLPGNCMQGGVSVFAGGVITFLLSKIPYTKSIMDKNQNALKKAPVTDDDESNISAEENQSED